MRLSVLLVSCDGSHAIWLCMLLYTITAFYLCARVRVWLHHLVIVTLSLASYPAVLSPPSNL